MIAESYHCMVCGFSTDETHALEAHVDSEHGARDLEDVLEQARRRRLDLPDDDDDEDNDDLEDEMIPTDPRNVATVLADLEKRFALRRADRDKAGLEKVLLEATRFESLVLDAARCHAVSAAHIGAVRQSVELILRNEFGCAP